MTDSSHSLRTPGVGKFTMTYQQFCNDYTPGPYSKGITAAGLRRDDNDLRLILIAAHLRLDQIFALEELPHRRATQQTQAVPLTSHRATVGQWGMELRSA